MHGRQSHGGQPLKATKTKGKDKTRSLRALEIASQENSENVKVRHHRLGVSEGGNRPGKRARDQEDSEEDEDEGSKPKKSRKNPQKGRFDELDIDHGSDSEGNEWMLGQVASDDDSDLDSDAAFGESDEERFEDYAFGGSSTKGKASKKNRSKKDLTLNEDDEDSASESGSDESLGEDAIDLAQMLDDEDEDMDADSKDGSQTGSSDDDESEDDSGDESEMSSGDSDDEQDPAKLAALRNLIDALPQSTSKISKRKDRVNEFNNPSDFGLISNNKITLDDLGLPSAQDPHIKKSLKFIESGKPGRKVTGKLDVPLARRQQDRLDRDAAYVKTKETLDKWTDTVKHNRRADHLQFPLPDPDAASVFQNNKLQPTTNSKPFNALEAAIQNIMEESGLATSNGRDDEDKIKEFEELEAKKMTLDEVKARRDQLRAARDLLFREEAKAKRIKKIKSKSYRRVHRKQREKDERMTREALEEAGIEPSEDEQELQDRRRAAERMGARHRSSKWAKATKDSGRAAWDDDARAGITDMARRNEELRKRVEGRTTKRNDEDGSDVSESEPEDDDSSVDDDDRMRGELDRLDAMGSADTSGSKLANMKFMKNAEATRKKENDAAVEQLRRELAGEESESEDDDAKIVGRRSYGPSSEGDKKKAASKATKRNEFEEPLGSDDDEYAEITTQGPIKDSSSFKSNQKASSKPSGKPSRQGAQKYAPAVVDNLEGGAWSRRSPSPEGPRKSKKGVPQIEMEELDLSQAVVMKKPKKTTTKKPTMLQVDEEGSDSESENTSGLPFAIRDQELIKRAFAGADVVGEFEREKRQTIQDEDEKVVDNALPGWGSWAGEGVSKRERNKNKGRFLTKVDGIKADKRKDAKLEKVIINEKRVKKNAKYLASSLPHQFETRQQYERSLRMPVGPEWSTKETFQDSTKPRVLLKQGIIAPMSKPLF